jgi:hypothetical protein
MFCGTEMDPRVRGDDRSVWQFIGPNPVPAGLPQWRLKCLPGIANRACLLVSRGESCSNGGDFQRKRELPRAIQAPPVLSYADQAVAL